MSHETVRRLPLVVGLAAALLIGFPTMASAASRGSSSRGGHSSSFATARRGGERGSSRGYDWREGRADEHGRVGVRPDIDEYYWGPAWGFGLDWGWEWPYYGPFGPAYYYPPPYGYYRVLPRHAAAVEFHVHPWKANIRIDGHAYGQARDYNDDYDSLAVKAGDHTLELSYPGYMTLRVPLDITAGAHYNLRFRLEEGQGIDPRSEEVATPEAAPAGALRIEVEPPDAVVYLDGGFLGRADRLAAAHGPVEVKPGRHRVEAMRPGYHSRTVSVTVAQNKAARVTIDLQPSSEG